MKRKLTGSATGAIILFVASGMFASILGVRQVERYTTVPTWVASTTLAPGQTITTQHLTQKRVDKDDAAGTLQDANDLIGRTLRIGKEASELIAPQDLQRPLRKSLSSATPEGRVLYSIRQPASSIPATRLANGDRFDVVVRGRRGVRVVARDVQLIGVIQPRSQGSKAGTNPMDVLKPKLKNGAADTAMTSLVIAIRPGDVYPLASIGGKEQISLVLHSARDVASGNYQNIEPASRFREVEIVAGLRRSKVRVQL